MVKEKELKVQFLVYTNNCCLKFSLKSQREN